MRMRVCVVLAILAVVVVDAAINTEPVYNPKKSKSKRPFQYKAFGIQYIDGSVVEGKIVEDTVALAGYSGTGLFGAADKFEGSSWYEDGLVGLGQYNVSNPDFYIPLMYSLGTSTSKPLLFALYLTEEGGEIQVGGYVSDSAVGVPTWTNIINKCTEESCPTTDYRVEVTEIRVGLTTLTTNTVETVIDSGYTCITLPTDADGDNVFLGFTANLNYGDSLYFTIDGTQHEVLYTDYVTDETATCVDANEYDAGVLVLGDPFFRATLAIFDNEESRVGLAPIDRNYNPAAVGSGLDTQASSVGGSGGDSEGRSSSGSAVQVTRSDGSTGEGLVLGLERRVLTGPSRVRRATSAQPRHARHVLADESALTEEQLSYYFADVAIGDPPVTATLQIDTGSSLLVVYSTNTKTSGSTIMAAFIVPIFLVCCSYSLFRYLKSAPQAREDMFAAGDAERADGVDYIAPSDEKSLDDVDDIDILVDGTKGVPGGLAPSRATSMASTIGRETVIDDAESVDGRY